MCRLLSDVEVGPYNTPRLGEKVTTEVPVTAAEANGEVGFADPGIQRVSEPEGTPTRQVGLMYQDQGVCVCKVHSVHAFQGLDLSWSFGPMVAFGVLSFVQVLESILQILVVLVRQGTNGAATVHWALSGSGSSADDITQADITPWQGSVAMASGQSRANILLEVLADDTPETDEEVTLTLTQVEPVETQRLRPGAIQKVLVVAENDNAGGVFEFASTVEPSYTMQVCSTYLVHSFDPGVSRYSVGLKVCVFE